MSLLARRDNQLNTTVGSNLQPASSYTVYVLEPGALVQAAASASNTVRVYKGHGFAANDKFIVGASTSQFKTISSIDTSNSAYDEITLAASATVTASVNDVLVNLGVDTGTTSPNYDAAAVAIYDDPAGATTAKTNSAVTSDSAGNYGYWTNSRNVWELVMDGSSPSSVITDASLGYDVADAVNVRTFGATGDGTTDDTTAIQSAATAATGSRLYFPEGTYLISSTVLIPAGTEAFGHGATIKVANAANINAVRVDDVSNVYIHDLTIDGNSANQTNSDRAALYISYDNANIDNVRVERLYVKEYYGYGIRLNGDGTTYSGTNIVLHHNTIKATEGHGIFVNRDAPGVVVSDNVINATAAATANGIWVGNDSDYAVISGNQVYNPGDMGIEYFSNTTGCGSITGNTIYSPGTMGVSVASSDHTTVSGNAIQGAVTYGVEIATSDYCSVTGNTVDTVSSGGFGIMLDKSSGCVVSGNALVDVGGASPDAAIRIFADGTSASSRNLVTSNTIDFPASGAVRGIDIFCNAAGATVSGNLITANNIYGNGVASSQGIGVNNPGSGTVATNDIYNNRVENCATLVNDSAANVVAAFTDADATPSILGGQIFKTANTGATTITAFDDGYTGQRVVVLVQDGNTTIDFTGTALKGNAGADWSPANGDWMECVYDGTNWYCSVHDTTA